MIVNGLIRSNLLLIFFPMSKVPHGQNESIFDLFRIFVNYVKFFFFFKLKTEENEYAIMKRRARNMSDVDPKVMLFSSRFG